MSAHDDHVLHTWNLTRDKDGGELSIDLWIDGYTVRVDGGPDDGYDSEGGRQVIEQELLPKYAAAGYRVDSSYAVNTPAVIDDETDDEPEGADQRPEKCPECGTTDMEYVPNHLTELRDGPAWMCTGCKWGQWIVV
jgi:hypothetical protein